MDSNEPGTRAGVFLVIFLGFGLYLSIKTSIFITKSKKIAWRESLLLNQTPFIFGICAWLILMFGTDWAIIDLIASFLKMMLIVAFFLYMIKTICNEDPYSFGRLQYQIIQINKIPWLCWNLNLNSCKKVNRYIKFQITIATIYFLIVIAKIGIGAYFLHQDYGTWGINVWSLFRLIDIVLVMFLFWSFQGLKNAAKKLGLAIDQRFFMMSVSIIGHSLHPLLALFISFTYSYNSNELIVYLSNLFVLVEMIVFTFYQSNLK